MATPNTTASLGDIDAISLLQESGLTPQQIADAIKKIKELNKTATQINEALTKLDSVTKAQLDAAVISGGGTVTSSGSFTKTFVVGDWVGTTTKTLTIPQTTHLLGVGYKDVTIFDATDIATTVGYSVDDTTGNVTLTTTGTAFAGSAFIVGGASAGGGTSLTTDQTAAVNKIVGLEVSASEINRVMKRRENKVIIFGDSITARTSETIGVNYTQGISSYWNIANWILDSKFNMIYNAGISGNTTNQMKLRLQADVIDRNPDMVIILGGTNDLIANTGLNDTISNLTSIYNSLMAEGIIPVLCTVPSASTFVSQSNWNLLNEFIVSFAFDNGLRCCDFASSFISVSNSVFPYHITNATSDGTHPTKRGAYLMGVDLAETIKDLVGISYPTSPANNSSNNLITNTLLTGTSGTIPNGVAPTGWTNIISQVNANITYTGSIESKQKYNIYKIDISNSGSNIGEISFQVSISSGFSVGETIRTLLGLDLTSCKGVALIEPRVIAMDSSFSTLAGVVCLSNDSLSYSLDDLTAGGIIRFPDMTIPLNTTKLVLIVKIRCVSGTVRIYKPSMMKV